MGVADARHRHQARVPLTLAALCLFRAAASAGSPYAPGELLVKYRPAAGHARAATESPVGATVIREFPEQYGVPFEAARGGALTTARRMANEYLEIYRDLVASSSPRLRVVAGTGLRDVSAAS